MMRLLAVALTALTIAGCGGGGGSGSKRALPDNQIPKDSGVAPAAVLNLENWELTLPVDEIGGTAGLAADIATGELLDGYASPYFYATEDGGEGIAFFAPVNGARTANSTYPRSELREMLDPGDASVNWTTADFAELLGEVAVNAVPLTTRKVVIAEILGYNGVDPAISDLMKLVFQWHFDTRRASLYALVTSAPASGSAAISLPLTESARMNERFTFGIRVEDGVLTVTAGGVSQSTPIASAWDGVGVYFRAGVSPQQVGTSATEGGRVTYYALDVSH